MAIQWTPDLSVGIEEIDRQHQQLFAACDGLLEAMRMGKGRDEVAALLDFLEGYVTRHFGAEEHAMSEAGYARVSEHEAEHRGFVERFAELKRRHDVEGANTAVVIQTVDEICVWLRRHIAGTDRMMGGFLRSRRR